jgi:hypothetical protein
MFLWRKGIELLQLSYDAGYDSKYFRKCSRLKPEIWATIYMLGNRIT